MLATVKACFQGKYVYHVIPYLVKLIKQIYSSCTCLVLLHFKAAIRKPKGFVNSAKYERENLGFCIVKIPKMVAINEGVEHIRMSM